MTRINKSAFNVREKFTELGRRFGLKGSELAAAETIQDARDLVSAGRKNLIINGAMQVWQRGTSLTGLSNGSNVFLADRWKYAEGGTMSAVVTMSQESDVPTGQGFGYSLKVSPTTADAAIDANENQVFVYQIEAQDLLQLGYGTSNAKVSTLSFWVKSSQAGVATIWFLVPSGQSCALQYKIHQSGTWQKIILTVPANTLGTTPNSNASGMTLYWNMAAGTDFTGTGGNDGFWGTQTNTGRAIGQTVNYLRTTSDYFQITGIQLEVGKNATEFEHRSYGEELALCQRYYERHTWESTGNQYVGVGVNYQDGQLARFVFPFLTRKRVVDPVTTFSGTYNAYPPNETVTLSPAQGNDTSVRINVTRTTSYNGGSGVLILGTAGSYTEVNAEL